MPFNLFFIGTVTFVFLLFLILLVTRIRHRVLVERELMYLIGQDSFEYILIDIRGSQDYERAHIPSAFNVPYPNCLEYLPTENMFKKIYIYGRNRYQSRVTAKKMSITGYFNVSWFGAFREWKGPVEMENKEGKNERKLYKSGV